MEKERKFTLNGNVLFGCLIIAATIIFMQTNINPYISKTIASLLFVLCGLFNFIILRKYHKGSGYLKSLILLIGLVFAMVGDIVLIGDFTLGAIFFAVGHVFFLAYFCTLYKISLIDIIIFLGLITFALLVIFLYPHFVFDGLLPVIIVYAVIISAMLAKAIGNYIKHRGTANLVSLLGAFLFFFSDMMLLFFRFGGHILVFDYLCVYTYYPAEFLLALSLLLHKDNYKK